MPTDTDIFIRCALWAGLGASAAIVLCCIVILIIRFGHLARERRLSQLQSAWREVLAAGVAGERLTVAVAARDRWDFLKLWCAMHDSVRGEARHALRKTAQEMGLPAWATKFAARRRLRERLLGLASLGRLGETWSAALVEVLIDDADPVISLTAAQSYVRLIPARALPDVIKNAARRRDWPASQIVELLREAGGVSVAEPLLEVLRAARGEARLRLIPFLAVLDAAQSATMLQELCAERDDPECVAGALRLLRGPEHLGSVRAAAAHFMWFVRVQACRALGRFGTSEDLPLLLRLLGDRQWWVRYRAAESLLRMPFIPKQDLRVLANQHPDRYARDMLGMWLDATGVGR